MDDYDPDIYDLFHPPDRRDGEDSDIYFFASLPRVPGLDSGTRRGDRPHLVPIARAGYHTQSR